MILTAPFIQQSGTHLPAFSNLRYECIKFYRFYSVKWFANVCYFNTFCKIVYFYAIQRYCEPINKS